MKNVALTLFMSLFAAAAAPAAPKRLECQIGYSWLAEGGRLRVEERRVSKLLARHGELPRYVAEEAVVTANGRYEITVRALQPLKGDLFSLESVGIQVLDRERGTLMAPGRFPCNDPRRCAPGASFSLTFEMRPNEPVNGLDVSCGLL